MERKKPVDGAPGHSPPQRRNCLQHPDDLPIDLPARARCEHGAPTRPTHDLGSRAKDVQYFSRPGSNGKPLYTRANHLCDSVSNTICAWVWGSASVRGTLCDDPLQPNPYPSCNGDDV